MPVSPETLGFLSLPGIQDARILHLKGVSAGLSVAFVSGPAACRLAREASAAAFGVDVIVPTTRLGTDEALAALPLWTPDALSAVTDALVRQPDVAEAAVVSLPTGSPRHLPQTHLVPEAPAQGKGPAGEASPALVPPVDRTPIGQALSDRRALSEAPALEFPADFPLTLIDSLKQAAHGGESVVFHRPDGTARRESHAQILRRATTLLAGLRGAGLTAGDIALLDVTDAEAFVGAFWACVLGGIVPAPIALPTAGSDPGASDRLEAAWKALGHPCLLACCPPDRVPASMDVMLLGDLTAAGAGAGGAAGHVAADPDATAVILLTSGSSGVPKGVPQSHRALLSLAAAIHHGLGLGPSDVFLNWMPRDHVGAVAFHMVCSTTLGCAQVNVDTSHVLEDPTRWLDIVSVHGVTVTWAPNFAYAVIGAAAQAIPEDRRAWDLSSLRVAVNGGEAVAEDSLQEFLHILAPYGINRDTVMVPSFGMSETCSALTIGRLGRARGPFTSLGRPVAGAALRITDEAGNLLREGEIGRLEVRGPQILRAYHERPDLDAPADHDGWFDTGDAGFLADGELYLTGRLKETLNANGATYFAHEVEAAAAVPGIDSTSIAAIPIRQPDMASEGIAVIAAPLPESGLDDDAVTAALARAMRTRLARRLGLVPDQVILCRRDALPRTGIGKIVRRSLSEMVEGGRFDAGIDRIRRLLGGPGTCDLPLHSLRWLAVPPAMVEPGAGDDLVTGRLDGATPSLAGRTAVIDDAADPYGALLSLARSVQALPAGSCPRTVIVVTRGAVAVTPGEQPATDHALVPGLVRALGLQMPHLRWRAVDIDDDTVVADVLSLEASQGAEPVVAWRHGQRLAPRFAAIDPPPTTDVTHPVTPGSLWLVAGALGGIGQLVCARLLARGAKILAIGRTAQDDLPAARATALAHLHGLGDVQYATVDVADGPALAAAVAHFEQAADRTLAGAFHLAGQGRPLALDHPDLAAEVAAMRRTALDGVAAMAAVTGTRPGARLVVVGSIVGQVGSRMPGYAAAQAALAEAVRARIATGAKLSFLSFSAWRDVGLSQGQTSDALVRADGLVPLDPDDALLAVDAALWRPGTDWMVGLDGAHPLHACFLDAPPALAARPVAWVRGDRADGAGSYRDALGRPAWVLVRAVRELPRDAKGEIDIDRLTTAMSDAPIAPRDETERQVARLFADVLGGAPPAVNDDFFVIGGTSLGAVRLAARLSSLFFVEVSVGMVFRSPTVEGMVSQLRALEPQPGMTDAVAGHLATMRRDATGTDEAEAQGVM